MRYDEFVVAALKQLVDHPECAGFDVYVEGQFSLDPLNKIWQAPVVEVVYLTRIGGALGED